MATPQSSPRHPQPSASHQPSAISPDTVTVSRDEGRGLLTWWREADAKAHRAIVAATLGWMLETIEVIL